jgi:acetyl-CoA carboxylase biotin carboxyl carrier protein
VEKNTETPRVRPGRRVIARLADEVLPVLIARLEASTLGELEVREDGWRVRLRRPLHRNGNALAPVPTRAGTAVEVVAEPASAAQRAERHERERTQLTSPAVGYFVPRDGLSVGVSLRGGDVIGHIDVLGVQQEVVMPEDGILARIDVEPGQAVEYGQPIARLEPEARG